MKPGTYEARSLDTAAVATVPLHGEARGRLTRERIVAAVAAFWSEHGYAPTVREVGAAAVGVRSSSAVAEHLQLLADAGRVRFAPHTPRSLRVVER